MTAVIIDVFSFCVLHVWEATENMYKLFIAKKQDMPHLTFFFIVVQRTIIHSFLLAAVYSRQDHIDVAC